MTDELRPIMIPAGWAAPAWADELRQRAARMDEDAARRRNQAEVITEGAGEYRSQAERIEHYIRIRRLDLIRSSDDR